MVALLSAEVNTGTVARRAPSRLLELFRVHGPAFQASHPLTWEQHRFLRAVQVCRTAALGGHLYVCDSCGYEHPVYNSCRNRHCPACQALDQARWIQKRKERLLPVGHHHVIFTLPAELRPLSKSQPRLIHDLLFNAASTVLKELSCERWKARLGATTVLHTWTRRLSYHPHLHCIVTAGGLSLSGDHWIDKSDFLFPVRKLKFAFASEVLRRLQSLRDQGLLSLSDESSSEAATWTSLLKSLPDWRKWVIHIQPPFGRSAHVLEYLGRYTHRVAISDGRVVDVNSTSVTFRTHGDDRISLPIPEFIRRFLLHVLPTGFHKIRHYGLYASGSQRYHALASDILAEGDSKGDREGDYADPDTWDEHLAFLTGDDALRCPNCSDGRLVYVRELPPQPRAPP